MINNNAEKIRLEQLAKFVPAFPEPVTLECVDWINNTQVITDEQQITALAITDHPPLIAVTNELVIATMNLWCPGTYISPSQCPTSKTGLYRIKNDVDKMKQVELLANYISQLFCAGVDIFLLQEVALTDSKYFDYFTQILMQTKAADFIDIPGLKDSFSRTQRAPGSYHDFGCALLINKNILHFTSEVAQKTPILDARGFVYHLTYAKAPKTSIEIHNIHGDYKNSVLLAQHIKEHVKGTCIVGGDLNIPVSGDPVCEKSIQHLSKASGACYMPPITNPSVAERSKTVDGLFISSDLNPEYLYTPYQLPNSTTALLSQSIFVKSGVADETTMGSHKEQVYAQHSSFSQTLK